MKKISILGSTGSIGEQAVEVCDELSYKVVGLAAKSSVDKLVTQAARLKPEIVCIYDESRLDELKQKLLSINIDVRVVSGMSGLCEAASVDSADIVLNSVVGMIGLRPTLSAIEAKKDVALANKETLVTGGKLVTEAAHRNGVKILPVDSEHSAIFQSLQGNDIGKVKRIILTASGGPFFGSTKSELEKVRVEDALKHPNWDMGAKITIDSATLMNKGLELIEACWLFDKRPNEVEIVVHRESVIHSLVEYVDNAIIAQLGVPDMRLPIQYALTYPSRAACNTPRLSLTEYGRLTFADADSDTFICLKACIEAINKGGLYPTVVNGANEQAVELFLNRKISFLDIGELVYASLTECADSISDEISLENILLADKIARNFVLSKASEKR